MNQSIDLNGTWQLRWNDGVRGERLNRVLAGDVDWTRAWRSALAGHDRQASGRFCGGSFPLDFR